MIKNGRAYTPISEGGIGTDMALVTDGSVINAMSTADFMSRVFSWINEHIEPSKRRFKDNTSYGLKHYLESDMNCYLTNNQFKDAMLLCGYLPTNPDEQNWYFKIKLNREDEWC